MNKGTQELYKLLAEFKQMSVEEYNFLYNSIEQYDGPVIVVDDIETHLYSGIDQQQSLGSILYANAAHNTEPINVCENEQNVIDSNTQAAPLSEAA